MMKLFVIGIAGLIVASVIVFGGGSEESYESIVVFRNDDVKAVDGNLEKIQKIFDEENIPVTHSVIPEGIKNSGDYNQTCGELRDLSSNSEIAIHGYNHEGLEFKNSDWNEIQDKIVKIENFSQECLNSRPEVFVAPHNAMSSDARILLNESGFNVISADRKMAWQTGDSKIVADRREFINERPLELGQSSMMVEIWGTEPVTFSNLSSLKTDFDESVESNEIHVQTIHYNTLYSNNQSEKLGNLIDYMDTRDVYFSSLEEVAVLFEEDRIRFTGQDWVIE